MKLPFPFQVTTEISIKGSEAYKEAVKKYGDK